MQFDVYWAPDGRKIATVEAKDRRAAIRKAPKPYRKFLGELYATNAWQAKISLWSEGFLLGGTRMHVSSGFKLKSDAIAFGQQSLEVNRGRPGYQNADITVDIEPCYAAKPV